MLNFHLNIGVHFNIAKHLDIQEYLNITRQISENVELKRERSWKMLEKRYKNDSYGFSSLVNKSDLVV